MKLKTDKSRDELALEFCIAQLRHAYQQLAERNGNDDMGYRQMRSFADGLLAPVIKRLEKLADGGRRSGADNA